MTNRMIIQNYIYEYRTYKNPTKIFKKSENSFKKAMTVGNWLLTRDGGLMYLFRSFRTFHCSNL